LKVAYALAMIFPMTAVAKIKQAVQRLPRADYRKFRRWFEAQEDRVWDREIARDAKAGKFDRLVEESVAEYQAGKTTKTSR
jgi:hypothetical protein